MSHTKEPWRLCEHGSKTSLAGNTHGWHIERDDGTENGRLIVWEQINEDEGRRIVACVNACAGMSDPAAEIAALRAEVEQAKRRADSYNEKFQRQCELTDEAVRQRMVAERAIVSAADAEAEPVAWVKWFRTEVCVVPENTFIAEYAIEAGWSPLYTCPQPAPDVGVLVEALERIYKFPLETKAGDPMAVLEMGSIAGNALDAWRAKR